MAALCPGEVLPGWPGMDFPPRGDDHGTAPSALGSSSSQTAFRHKHSNVLAGKAMHQLLFALGSFCIPALLEQPGTSPEPLKYSHTCKIL